MHETVEAVLNFHAKPGAERLQGGAGQPILGCPAYYCATWPPTFCGWTLIPPGRQCFRYLPQVLESQAGHPGGGRAARSRGLSALCFADVANQHSTLPLGWVVSSFDDLGTGMWVFGLVLGPSGSTDRI